MQVVASWTGAEADALRQALRLTNESFAGHLVFRDALVGHFGVTLGGHDG